MKPSRRIMQWVAVPVAIVLLAEIAGHALLNRRTEWYEQSAPKSVDFVFVGSSRVEAGFDEKAFQQRLFERTGEFHKAWNVGAGNSTMAAHYLGIRNFIGDRGGAEGLTVFFELDAGIPSQLFAGTWKDSWVRPDAPYVLSGRFRNEDVGPFLRSNTSPQNKANILTRFGLRSSSLVQYRDGWQSNLMKQGTKAVEKALQPISPEPEAVTSGQINGLNNDPLAIEAAKRANRTASRKLSVDVDDWEAEILADFVRLVQHAGGKVVFVEVPVGHVIKLRLSGARYEKDKAGLARAMKAWGTAELDPQFTTTLHDFPDLDHLSKPAAKRFSAQLADTYVDADLQRT